MFDLDVFVHKLCACVWCFSWILATCSNLWFLSAIYFSTGSEFWPENLADTLPFKSLGSVCFFLFFF